MADKNSMGIEHDKIKDTNAWYTDIIKKCNLIEYTEVSGCYILRPKAQYIWDEIRKYIDNKILADGVKNASFPLLIPEKYLLMEQDHVEGFAPEVAWVTHTGESELKEKLAVRPTSETIMYASYSKWIRSHKDLPLRLNQWCSVVRWEFKNPIPFLRSREFHWQEGHTAFATKEEADAEAMKILMEVYKKTYEELLAIPCLVGRKSHKEKFAGADYSLSCEVFLPIGKAIQGCTSHHLGQNFAKPFDITFLDGNQQKQHVWQNSWGFTTRSVGVMIMAHSDSKGLVLPPRVAENKVIIVPILSKGDNSEILNYSNELMDMLVDFDPKLDDRTDYSPGWKFNEAELNGYPIRVELGKKEMEENMLTLVRRDTLEKVQVKKDELKQKVKQMLDDIHNNLFQKAKQFLDESIVEAYDPNKIAELVKQGKIVKTVFFNSKEVDELIREKTTGKTLVIPFNEKPKEKSCPFSGKQADSVIYIAKSL